MTPACDVSKTYDQQCGIGHVRGRAQKMYGKKISSQNARTTEANNDYHPPEIKKKKKIHNATSFWTLLRREGPVCRQALGEIFSTAQHSESLGPAFFEDRNAAGKHIITEVRIPGK